MNDRAKFIAVAAAVVAFGAILIPPRGFVAKSGAHAVGKRDTPMPTFDIETDQMRTALIGLSKPWSGAPVQDDRRPDAFSGGTIDHVVFRGGLATLYGASAGKLWRITLQTGIVDRCGSRADRDAGVKAVRSMLGSEPLRVTLVNGCLNTAVITAL